MHRVTCRRAPRYHTTHQQACQGFCGQNANKFVRYLSPLVRLLCWLRTQTAPIIHRQPPTCSGRHASDRRSLHEAETHERPESREPVAPGDLLALAIIPPSIVDGHLIDAVALPRHLRGDLRLEVEAV